MYNSIEYSNACSKTSRSLWQYYRDEPALNNNGNIIGVPDNNDNSALFNFFKKITRQTGNCGTKEVEGVVLLKYLSKFWRTLEIPVINCEISLQLKWSRNCIIVAGIENS